MLVFIICRQWLWRSVDTLNEDLDNNNHDDYEEEALERQKKCMLGTVSLKEVHLEGPHCQEP